jgi:hypothetical protein
LVKKVLIFFICMMVVEISIPVTKSSVVNNSVNNNSGPILDIMIFSKFSLFTICFIVENICNATVHNVTYSGINITGNVIYNSRTHVIIIDELVPREGIYGWSDRFIGFGRFTANITITCDEGIATASANGIVFGPFNFIP